MGGQLSAESCMSAGYPLGYRPDWHWWPLMLLPYAKQRLSSKRCYVHHLRYPDGQYEGNSWTTLLLPVSAVLHCHWSITPRVAHMYGRYTK